jgi:hypothetical protein
MFDTGTALSLLLSWCFSTDIAVNSLNLVLLLDVTDTFFFIGGISKISLSYSKVTQFGVFIILQIQGLRLNQHLLKLLYYMFFRLFNTNTI